MPVIPDRFPFAGSGPAEDYRYELLDYRPGRPTMAESWQRIEDGVNYLYGKHRMEYPAVVVEDTLYAGGHTLSGFLRINQGAMATALDCGFWILSATNDYTFSLSESAGGNSVNVLVPGSASDVLWLVASLPLTTTGLTTLSIAGDPVALDHPWLRTFHFRVMQLRRY